MGIEQQGMKFVVDTTSIARGMAEYESAIEGVFADLDRFEAHVKKTMGGVSKAFDKASSKDVKKIVSTFAPLRNIDIDAKAATKISALSAAMAGYKAPSSAQAANTKKFFQSLGSLPDLSAAYRSIKNIGGLSQTMAGFKAPSKASSTNMAAMANALRKFEGIRTPGSSMTNFLANVGQFKGPSAAQTRNLQNFITTLGSLKVPTNAGGIAGYLNQIASAAANANARLGGLRGSMGGLNSSLASVGKNTRSATLNMMGLQNAFSGTFQIGSALRTLFGALTVGELGRSFFEASNAALSFKAQMGVLSKETGFADSQLRYVNETSRRLGIDMLSAERGFAKLSIAADKSGVSVKDTRTIFEGFSTAMTVLGTSTERQNDVFLAMQQILNKGYLSSEELNQQLNEHLPGAMQYAGEMAKKMGVSLEDALKKKMISATDYLIYASKRMQEDFGPAMAEALKKPSTQMTILRGNVASLYQTIGRSGANQGVAELLGRFNSYLSPDKVERFGKAVGEKLYGYLNKLGDALDYVYQNWDKIKGPLATTLKLLGSWMVVSGSLQIGRFIVSPLLNAYSAATMLAGKLPQTITLLKALSSTQIATPVNAQGAAALTGGFAATLDIVNRLKMGVQGLTFSSAISGVTNFASKASTALGGVGGLVLKLGGVIATGLTAAWAAARDENGKFASDSYSTFEIVKGAFLSMCDFLAPYWADFSKMAATVWSKAGSLIGSVFGGIADIGKETLKALAFGFISFGKIAGSAVVTLGDLIYRVLSKAFSAMGNFLSGNWSAGASDIAALFKKETYKGVSDGLVGAIDNAFNGKGRAEFDKNLATGAAAIDKQLAAWGQRGRGPAAPAPKRPETPVDTAATHQGQPQTPLPTKGEKTKKGPTQDQLDERAQDKLRRALDSITRRYAEDNPVFKVTQDFMSDLMAQADDLLQPGAYKTWFGALKAGSAESGDALSSLITALKGAGAETQVLEGLEKTYGISKGDLIKMLEQEGVAYQRNLAKKKEEMTFGFEVMKQMKAESEMMKLSERDQRTAAALIEMVNDAKQKGIEITQQMIDARRAEIESIDKQNQLLEKQRTLWENNGMRQYLGDAIQTADVVQALDRDTFQGLEDTLYDLGMTGKLSFKNMLESIQSDIMRYASKGVTKQIMDLFMPGASGSVAGGGSPSLWGGFFQKITGQDANDPSAYKNREELVGAFGGANQWKIDPLTGGLLVSVANLNSLSSDYGAGQGAFGVGQKIGGGINGALNAGLGVIKPVVDAAGNIIGGIGENAIGATMGMLNGATGAGNPLMGSGAAGVFAKDSMGGAMSPGGGIGGGLNQPIPAIENTTKDFAQSFGETMKGTLPMLGMAFSATFKSPIAQIGGMFLTMMLSKMMQGGAGGGSGGGFLGELGGIFGFAEGTANTSRGGVGARYSVHPSSFAGAPHYKEGTPNTSGGMPAVLHPNEAVIPLSRGRKVPVELAGADTGGSSGRSGTVVNNNFNISSPDADSFRKSRGQIATEMHVAAGRAARRNGG